MPLPSVVETTWPSTVPPGVCAAATAQNNSNIARNCFIGASLKLGFHLGQFIRGDCLHLSGSRTTCCYGDRRGPIREFLAEISREPKVQIRILAGIHLVFARRQPLRLKV